MVLERQPALHRANPQLLADRIAAYTRATGISAYNVLYMVARKPTLLQLPPAGLLERVEELSRALVLPSEQVLRLLVSQPHFLDLPPDTLRALSGRVAGELRVRPTAALNVLAGLPPGELRGLLSRPPGMLRERLLGLRRVLKLTFGSKRATAATTLLLISRCPALLALPPRAVAASLEALMSVRPTKAALASPPSGGGGAAGGLAAGGGGATGVNRTLLDAVLACPHVLTLPPAVLRARFVELAAAARIDLGAVVNMLLLQPRLLLVDPAKVRAAQHGGTQCMNCGVSLI